MEENWFKPKKYPHIGLPLMPQDRRRVVSYVKNPIAISRHAFMPLIQRVQNTYRCEKIGGVPKRSVKKRPICYASHLDAQIYSFYGRKLEERYERYLKEYGYGECVIAYRSLPRETGYGNKCNIDLAKDAFDYIGKSSIEEKQVVIIADIKSFFDSLDHKNIKDAWREISRIKLLPNDEYAVFRHVVKYSYVDAKKLFDFFRTRIICQGKTMNRERTLASMRYFRDKKALAFCDKKEVSEIRRHGMIHRHTGSCGIPQGLPISAVLANMYMWRFDREMYGYMKSVGGYYRRYSDDIVLVCGAKHLDNVQKMLASCIAEEKLCISKEKTKIFVAEKEAKSNKIRIVKDGHRTQIEYLGLSYDGETVRLKNKSVSRYYHKMLKTIKAKKSYAIRKTDDTGGTLFVRQLLRKFTPIGSKRHPIFVLDRDNKTFVNSGKKSFGNYWTYVEKAARLCDSPAISHQLCHNRCILQRRIAQAKKEIANERAKIRFVEMSKYGKTYH